MGEINFGGQVCTVGYGAPALSTSWNLRNYGIVPTGVYCGGYLSITSGNSFSVDTLLCEIRDENYQVRIATTSPITLTLASTSSPYVVLRWVYSASATNYMDVLLVGSGSIQANDIVLGKCTCTAGPVLTGFDYADATYPRSTPNSFDVALRAESDITPSILRVWVRAGYIYKADGSASVKINDSALVFDAADGSNTRVDLVYVGDSGAAIVKGTAGAGVPAYGGKKVVAEVSIPALATTILQSYIKDVRPRL
jgi:hypothetical protein